MNSYIAQATPNSAQATALPTQGTQAPPDPWVFFYIALSGIGGFVASFIPKVLDSSILAKNVDANINQKQAETNAVVAERLTDINIEKQKEENFIDQATALAEIARAGVSHSADTTNYLLRLAEGALNSSAANTQSTQALSRASESQVEATKDLIKATAHNNEALEALKDAIKAIPNEIASINKVLVAEIHVALNSIDARLEEGTKIRHEGYIAIHEEIKRAENRIIEQHTGTIAQLRRDLKDLENAIKHPKID